MSDYPNWAIAPEGATHFHFGSVKYSSHWKKEGYFCVTDFESTGWREDFHPIPISEYIERPRKEWSGPEDGLPPIGTVCELTEAVLLADEDSAEWFKAGTQVDVGGHVMFKDATSSVCAICVAGDNFTGTLSASCLRPVQPLLDARNNAIREIMDTAGIDCLVTATRLVDAGFKREVA